MSISRFNKLYLKKRRKNNLSQLKINQNKVSRKLNKSNKNRLK